MPVMIVFINAFVECLYGEKDRSSWPFRLLSSTPWRKANFSFMVKSISSKNQFTFRQSICIRGDRWKPTLKVHFSRLSRNTEEHLRPTFQVHLTFLPAILKIISNQASMSTFPVSHIIAKVISKQPSRFPYLSCPQSSKLSSINLEGSPFSLLRNREDHNQSNLQGSSHSPLQHFQAYLQPTF